MSAGESGQRCAAARPAPAAGPDPRLAAGPGPTPTGADRGPGPHRPQMGADRGRTTPAPTCSCTAGAAPERRSARATCWDSGTSGPASEGALFLGGTIEAGGRPRGGGMIRPLCGAASADSGADRCQHGATAGGAGGFVGPRWGVGAPGHAAASAQTRCRREPPSPVLQAALRSLIPRL